MKIKYDEKSDSILFIIDEQASFESEEIQKDVVVDYDENEKIVAIEILNFKTNEKVVDIPITFVAA
jgi:uncharacterized protein YuzE